MPIANAGEAATVAAGHEYVDRGDPSDYDWATGDLTIDSAWHDLDLSSIVTDNDAVLVHLRLSIKDAAVPKTIQVRKNGNANAYNVGRFDCMVANIAFYGDVMVACDSSQVIEYFITTGMDAANITVKGWFKPA